MKMEFIEGQIDNIERKREPGGNWYVVRLQGWGEASSSASVLLNLTEEQVAALRLNAKYKITVEEM